MLLGLLLIATTNVTYRAVTITFKLSGIKCLIDAKPLLLTLMVLPVKVSLALEHCYCDYYGYVYNYFHKE